MKSHRYDVFALGNALVDIQANVDVDFLDRHGITKGVMTLVDAERQSALLALLADSPKATSSGGSACNTVVGLVGLGGTGYYAGKVGRDSYGAFFQKELNELGIRSDLPPVVAATGTCLVLNTPDADRTMLTCLSASVELGPDDVRVQVLETARYVYVEGYLWDAPGPRAACELAMSEAGRRSVKVAFTYSDPFCVSRAKSDFERISREQADLIFCNADEACMITGASDPRDACRAIASWGPDVFVTLGASGAVYGSKHELLSIQAFPVTAVDSNGAGDLFAGGALYGLSRGYAPQEAGRLGSYAASRVVQQVGARLSRSELARARQVLDSPGSPPL